MQNKRSYEKLVDPSRANEERNSRERLLVIRRTCIHSELTGTSLSASCLRFKSVRSSKRARPTICPDHYNLVRSTKHMRVSAVVIYPYLGGRYRKSAHEFTKRALPSYMHTRDADLQRNLFHAKTLTSTLVYISRFLSRINDRDLN